MEKGNKKVTVQGLINPVPAASVGVVTSHVSSLSSDCDPAVTDVGNLASAAVLATRIYGSPKAGDKYEERGDLPTSSSQSLASGGMADNFRPNLEAVNESVMVQSRELLDLLEGEGSIRLSQESVPADMMDDLTLTDEELEITLIPAPSSLGEVSIGDRNEECLNLEESNAFPDRISDIQTSEPRTPRQDALEVSIKEAGKSSREDTSSSTFTTGAESKGARDRKFYKRAVSYLRRFVDKDASSHTGREVTLIKSNLKLVRKFERNYPHAVKREFSINRILLPAPERVKTSKEERPGPDKHGDGPVTSMESANSSNSTTLKSSCSSPMAKAVEGDSGRTMQQRPTMGAKAVSKSTKTPKGTAKNSKKGSATMTPCVTKAAVVSAGSSSTADAKSSVSVKGPLKVALQPKCSPMIDKGLVKRPTGPTKGSRGPLSDPKGSVKPSHKDERVSKRMKGLSDRPSTSDKAAGSKKTGSKTPQKTVKRVRSTEDPQPKAKRTVPSRMVDSTVSYAAALSCGDLEVATGETSVGDKSHDESKSKSCGAVRSTLGQKAKPVPVEDLRMAIIDNADPEGKVSESHWLLVEGRLRGIIISDTGNQRNKLFGSAFLHKGVKVINCLNRESADFLVGAIAGLGDLWEGAKLAAVPFSAIPCRKAVSAWVPPPAVELADILTMLERQNPDLRTGGWKIIHSDVCKENGGLNIKVVIDKEGEDYLRGCEGKLNFGLGWIRFRFPPSQ